jgi:hypothetical protein
LILTFSPRASRARISFCTPSFSVALRTMLCEEFMRSASIENPE